MDLNERVNGAFEATLLAADGTPRLAHVAYDDDGYPHTDGEPLGQNSTQVDQIHYAFGALRRWVRQRFPDAFTGCDMFVYPQRGRLSESVAPDVFVALGAGDHRRNSYKLFEGEPVPSFVLEVLSGGTADKDLGDKKCKYARMGVGEYFMFDPFGGEIAAGVAAYRLRKKKYQPMKPRPGGYRSDVLKLEFSADGERLRLRDPATGEYLMDFDEQADARIAEAKARRAEATARRAAETRAEAEAKARRTEAEARRVAEAEVARLRRLLRDQ